MMIVIIICLQLNRTNLLFILIYDWNEIFPPTNTMIVIITNDDHDDPDDDDDDSK